MMVENFLTSPDSSVKYVTFKEEPTKTRQGVQRIAQRAVKPQMFATGGERCPVVLFEEMISRHPPELKLHGLFHLTCLSNVGNNWIQKIPLTAKLEILAVLEIFFIKLWITGYGQQVVLLHTLITLFFGKWLGAED